MPFKDILPKPLPSVDTRLFLANQLFLEDLRCTLENAPRQYPTFLESLEDVHRYITLCLDTTNS